MFRKSFTPFGALRRVIFYNAAREITRKHINKPGENCATIQPEFPAGFFVNNVNPPMYVVGRGINTGPVFLEMLPDFLTRLYQNHDSVVLFHVSVCCSTGNEKISHAYLVGGTFKSLSLEINNSILYFDIQYTFTVNNLIVKVRHVDYDSM